MVKDAKRADSGPYNVVLKNPSGSADATVKVTVLGTCIDAYLLCPAPRVGALSDDARLTSVCLSRTSGLSREQRGLGTLKLARDSDATFKVKRSKVNLQGRGHIVAASHTACLSLTFSCR